MNEQNKNTLNHVIALPNHYKSVNLTLDEQQPKVVLEFYH